jgi:O-antigen ligase
LASRDALFYALAINVLCYVWRVQDLFPVLGTIKFVPLATLAAVGLFVLDGDRRRLILGIKHKVLTYAGLILVWMVLSVPGSLYKGLSFNFILQDHIKTFVLMILLAASIRSIKDVERYVLVQVIGSALYCYFIMFKFTLGMEGRLDNLVYYDANDLGMLIVCTLPLAILFLRGNTSWVLRAFAAIVVLFSLKTIIKTGSRGAFLGMVAVMVFMLFQFRAFSKQARIVAVSTVVSLMLLIGNETYWDMMATILNPKDDYNWSGQSETGRMEVWKRGMGYMFSRPIFGVGARAFPVAEGTISEAAELQEYGIGLKWSAAHNSFVEVGAELGIPGLAFFCLVLATAFFACQKIGRTKPEPGRRPGDAAALGQALCTAIVGYVVAGFFLSQAYSAYMYVTYGIILGLIKISTATESRVSPALMVVPLRTRIAPIAHRPGKRVGVVGD